MNNWTVYRHTSPSGKVYIGITGSTAADRWKNGHGYRRQSYFFRAIQKYGWENFTHEIQYTGLAEQDAKSLEMKLIREHNSTDKMFGYNTTLGGDGTRGYVPPREVREKISCANRGKVRTPEMRKRYAAAKLGTHPSEETRQKMSLHHSDISGERNPMWGKTHSEETRQKISQTRKRLFAEGILVNPKKERPPTMTEDERRAFLSKRMSGENNPSYGKGLAVIQLDLSGNSICEYTTIRAAEKMTGVDHTTISRCCKGKIKTAGGFRWVYGSEQECTTLNS